MRSITRTLLAAAFVAGLASPLPAAAQTTRQLNFLYVHGVKSCDADRQNAQGSLSDLDIAIQADLPNRIAAWQAAHPGISVSWRAVRANLYTAPASAYHPSDSKGSLYMDDWEVGDPGCSTTKQGDPCTTAYEWRYRLKRVIETQFPADAQNIIIIGHSTGARVALEVAANVGPGGVGTYDWGVSNRIAGVVTVHGMVDGLQTSKYNFVGTLDFITGCKNGDVIAGIGGSCAPGNGWCEYAGNLSGFAAEDWVVKNKRALSLISYASCSPSAWTGYSDGSLPFDAQGSTWTTGLNMTPAPGTTWRPAHGIKYGSFCHSTITNAGDPNHAAAVTAAKDQILNWIFTRATRTAATGSISTSTSIAYNTSTPTYGVGTGCPAGEQDDAVAVGGVCKHPGYFDGDDHAIVQSEFTITNSTGCNGSFKWTQKHDSSNPHAATFWWKTYSAPAGGDLLSSLP